MGNPTYTDSSVLAGPPSLYSRIATKALGRGADVDERQIVKDVLFALLFSKLGVTEEEMVEAARAALINHQFHTGEQSLWDTAPIQTHRTKATLRT